MLEAEERVGTGCRLNDVDDSSLRRVSLLGLVVRRSLLSLSLGLHNSVVVLWRSADGDNAK